jgi:hypothetical protein
VKKNKIKMTDLPPPYEEISLPNFNAKQQSVLDRALLQKKNMCITGPGGVGK